MPEDNNELDKEYKRWRDYANVLLIGLTVMFAGPVISQRSIFSILSVIAGVIGILAVVSWHAREYKMQLKKRPLFLLIASYSLGTQAIFLVFHLVSNI